VACGREDDYDIFANSGFFQPVPEEGESDGGDTLKKERCMHKERSTLIPLAALLGGVASIGFAVLLAGAAITATPQQAQALPKYAAQTGLACGKCHVNPAGGGPRTAFGKAFAANGHKVKK
jgi:hypothetical protein